MGSVHGPKKFSKWQPDTILNFVAVMTQKHF